MYNVLSRKIRTLVKKLNDYYSQHNSLKKTIKRLKKNVKDLNECVELNECIDRKTVVNLIQKIVPLIIDKKEPKSIVHKGSFYLSKSFKESDSVKRIVIKENKTILYK